MGFFEAATFAALIIPAFLSATVRTQQFDDNEYPWSYQCVEETLDGPACQRYEVSNSSEKTPLSVCILTCGQYGGLWPYPSQVSLGKSLTSFNLGNISFDIPSVPEKSPKLLSMLDNATEIFLSYLVAMSDGEIETSSPNKVVVHLSVATSETKFRLGIDETYTLVISVEKEVVSATISAETYFGARHGLETLSQLIAFNSELKFFQVADTVDISDSPVFQYRGVLIDTARNFIPISDLKRLIDGLSFNKLNILHWHMTDSNSFPFFSQRVPQMVKYGTYSSNKIYYPNEISEFLAYANQRGVKVIPEFDMPAHAGNGWQWGPPEGLGELSLCVNAEPYRDYCIQPPCGQLNPLNEHMYNTLGELFRDFLEIFDNDIFHMGGDEISYKCWMAYPEIVDWLETHNTTDLMELWGLFQETGKLKEANDGADITAIVWTSEMTNFARQYLKPEDYIIQIWTKAIDDITTGIYEEGYRVIFSNNDTVYLDHGYGPWRGNYVNPNVPIKTWQVIYQNDILGQVSRQVGEAKMWELYNDNKLMGGVATMWAEKVDPINMDMKIWPRAAAYAERLWSNPPARLNVTQQAYPRLINQRQLLVERGMKADTLLPEACYHIWGFCDNEYW